MKNIIKLTLITIFLGYFSSCSKESNIEKNISEKSEMSLKQSVSEMKKLIEKDDFKVFFEEWVKVDIQNDFSAETIAKDLRQIKPFKESLLSLFSHAVKVFPTNDSKLDETKPGKVELFHSNIHIIFKNYHGSWIVDYISEEKYLDKSERLQNRMQNDFPNY